MDGWIHLKFGMPYPEKVSTAKMVNFCQAIIELQMRDNSIFLVPVKTHFYVARLHWRYLAA